MHPIRFGTLLALSASLAQAQTYMSAAKFEVASIKRCINPSAGAGEGGPVPDISEKVDRIRIPCWNLSALIRTAYVVFAGGRFNGNNYPIRIEQLPAWGDSETYAIEAKAQGSPGQSMMRGPMLQALLEDRFALKIHAGLRDEPAFALTIGKGGFRLQPFRGGCTPLDPIHPPSLPVPTKDICHGPPEDAVMSLDIFAWSLGKLRILDAPVINRTGIPGYFHFNLAALLKLAQQPTSAPSDDPLFASVFTAVQDLGLKLQSIRAPRKFLIVDQVKRPTPN